MKIVTILNTVLLTLLTAAAAFGISVVVLGHWWEEPAAPPPRTDLAAYKQQVIASVQQNFDTGDGTKDYRLHTDGSMSLINVTGDGNEYHGLIHVYTAKGTDVPVALTLYADPVTWMYELDQGSMFRLTSTAEKERG